MQRILQTCLKSEAEEVLLMTNRPPVLRFVDGIREIQVEPLTAQDVVSLERRVLSLRLPVPTLSRHAVQGLSNQTWRCEPGHVAADLG